MKTGKALGEQPLSVRIEALEARITAAGTPVRVQARTLELCLALATHGSRMSTLSLAELLYPEVDDASGLARLRVNALRTRRQVPGLLLTDGGHYRLTPMAVVDIDEISRNVDSATHPSQLCSIARKLLQPRDGFPFNRWSWFAPVEGRISQLTCDVLAKLLETDISERQSNVALEIARLAIYSDPCNELAQSLLIRAFLARHRRIDAVRAYEQYKSALKQQLNIEPSRDLRALVGA